MKHAAAHGRDHQPDGQQLQAHQRAAHVVGGHMGAQHGDMDRATTAPTWCACPARAGSSCACRRRGEPLPAAGRDHRRGPRRHPATEADPGKRHDIDMYAEGHKVRGAVKLPLNMLDALRAYDKDTTLKAAMGKEFSDAFLKLKHRPASEWNSFVSHFSRVGKGSHTLDI
jgi:hypothetical protein